MAKVALTIDGIRFEMEAKSVPAFLASMKGNAPKSNSPSAKTYIGEKELKEIASNSTDAEDFILNALSKQDGIHVVFSGLNGILKDVYKVVPRVVTDKMANDGLIQINPTKGGVRISLKK